MVPLIEQGYSPSTFYSTDYCYYYYYYYYYYHHHHHHHHPIMWCCVESVTAPLIALRTVINIKKCYFAANTVLVLRYFCLLPSGCSWIEYPVALNSRVQQIGWGIAWTSWTDVVLQKETCTENELPLDARWHLCVCLQESMGRFWEIYQWKVPVANQVSIRWKYVHFLTFW
jgi:hypothetical protein